MLKGNEVTQQIKIEILDSVCACIFCVFTYTTLPVHHEKASFLWMFPNVLLGICRARLVICLASQTS